jgi:hypothetical protein
MTRRGRAGESLLAVFFIACAGGCGDDEGDAGEADAGPPPSALRVTGTAEGTAQDGVDRVECTFLLDFINLTDDDAGGFSGVAAGEVFRRTFTEDSIRFEFSALVGGPADLAADGDDVELHLVGDQPAEAVPFWLALEALAGAETEPFEYEGEWTCAPVLVDDPMDSPIEAAGTWSAVPLVGAG